MTAIQCIRREGCEYIMACDAAGCCQSLERQSAKEQEDRDWRTSEEAFRRAHNYMPIGDTANSWMAGYRFALAEQRKAQPSQPSTAFVEALRSITAALQSDPPTGPQKTIAGDETIYHLDGQRMSTALNAARDLLAKYDAAIAGSQTSATPDDQGSFELHRKLAAAGVFAGFGGLEGLLNAQEFWDEQAYGTRLYYGHGGGQYLHRGVLRVAVEILKKPAQALPPRVGPETPDNSMVICPACTSQFVAIPVDVQAKLSAAQERIAWAWSIIANVSGGTWEQQSETWQKAARDWEQVGNPYEGLGHPYIEKYFVNSPAAPAASEEDVRMQARSLLRQAKCPECGCRGMGVDPENCDWCKEREALFAKLLADTPPAPPKQRTGYDAVIQMRDEFLQLVAAYNAVGAYKHAQSAQVIAIALNEFDESHILTSMVWPPRVIDGDHGKELELFDVR